MGKFTITESEKENILKLYGLNNKINEQEVSKDIEQRPGEKIVFDVEKHWPGGKYLLTSLEDGGESLKKSIQDAVTHMSKNADTNYRIIIEVGESQVTNYDREKCKTEVCGEEYKLEPKVLSTYRGDIIKNYLNKFLKEKNLFLPEIEIRNFIGKTKYDKNVPMTDELRNKYKSEQFVRVVLEEIEGNSCLLGATVEVAYIPGKSQAHNCDRAIFEFLINGKSVGIANLNNLYLDQPIGSLITKVTDPYSTNSPETIFIKRNAKLQGVDATTWLSKISEIKKKYQLDTAHNRKKLEGNGRSNTFVMTKEILDAVAPKGTKVLEFQFKPLVNKGVNDEFGWFDHDSDDAKGTLTGSHVETPYITIMSPKSRTPMFSGPTSSAVGGVDKLSKTETVTVLKTDLCGKPLRETRTQTAG